jgi:hypothetical protein
LDFEVQWDAGLAFGDVLADQLAGHVVWPIGYLRGENARGVGGEDGCIG